MTVDMDSGDTAMIVVHHKDWDERDHDDTGPTDGGHRQVLEMVMAHANSE